MQKPNTEELCYHCGEACEDLVIRRHEHTFCCDGCVMVFELLDENNLCTYYDIENSPGIQMKKVGKQKYAYLDLEEVVEGLLEFNDGGIAKVKLFIPSIHCSSCIWLLEKLNRLNEGVVSSQVHFVKKEVLITYQPEKVSLREVVELVDSIGYEPSIQLNNLEKDRRGGNKTFYLKLGVAGFAFGNIMLLSFPEYLSGDGFIEDRYRNLFGYLNLALALPVLLYSSADYFKSAWAGIKARYVNIDLPISIGIIALFLRSSYEILSGTGAGFMDSFTMLVFLLLVGKWYQNYTYQALAFDRDYTSYFPIAITRIVNGVEEIVTVRDLVQGDVVVVKNGEILPADGELLSSHASIDYSFVSGESDLLEKTEGASLYAGGRQVGAAIRVRITKAVSQSYLTQLWNQDAFAKGDSRMNTIVDRISKYFTTVVLLIGATTFFYWYAQGDLSVAVKAFTAVLIVACPCALALTVPFTLGHVTRVLGRNRIYLKNAESLELWARSKAILFDKTGTITQGDRAAVEYRGEEMSTGQINLVYSAVSQSNHPLSKVLASFLMGENLPVNSFEESPGEGILANIDGAWVRVGSLRYTGLDRTGEMPLSSLVGVAIDGESLGYFEINKSYRNQLGEVIAKLKEERMVGLISGDNDSERMRLEPVFGGNMWFNCKPEDKLEKVEDLQQSVGEVVMIGDGLNDAGALKQADVGIAVADDVHQFTPACDAIMDARSFEKLPKVFDLSAEALTIIRISFGISFAYNLVGMFFSVQGLLTPLYAAILMPISSVSVVGFVSLAVMIVSRRKGL